MDRRVAQLIETLENPEPFERVGAARELFEHLHEPAVVAALQVCRRDPNRAFRTFIDEGLTARGVAAAPAPKAARPAAPGAGRETRAEPDLFKAIGGFVASFVR